MLEKGYKRLTPGQPVGLRHTGYIIAVQNIIKVSLDGLVWLSTRRGGCSWHPPWERGSLLMAPLLPRMPAGM